MLEDYYLGHHKNGINLMFLGIQLFLYTHVIFLKLLSFLFTCDLKREKKKSHYFYVCLLGSKTLGTNVLEIQYVLCWQTMIKT